MRWFEKIWYEKPFRWYQNPLLLFSYLYQAGMEIRTFLYRFNLKKTTSFPVPVIVVGNLTVGGTGKTPTVIALAEILKEKGYKPGIVSRGYKGQSKQWPQVLNKLSEPSEVGEEPVLLFKRTGCPVVVDPNRVRAVKTLLDTTKCDIVLSDDGLQHLALGRDIEIAIVDAMRGLGNGHCLPCGPLRESPARLKKVDFVLKRGGQTEDVFAVMFESLGVTQVSEEVNTVSLSNFSEKPVHAVAGIGNPQQFFETLKSQGLDVIPHDFPDHHVYTPSDFEFKNPGEQLIMTEKDALKCLSFADESFYFLKIKAVFNPVFVDQFVKRVLKATRMKKYLSSLRVKRAPGV